MRYSGSSASTGEGGAPSGQVLPSGRADRWLAVADPDRLFAWATLLLIPAYAVFTGLRSHVFTVYLVLFVLQVLRNGYVRTGLEYPLAAAVLGLTVSVVGVWDWSILTRVLAVARILALPIMMGQFKPIRNLDTALAAVFSGLALYGLIRMLFAPLVTGYAQDRPYCYADFFMHSSVIAVSGCLFFLTAFFRKPGWAWKTFSAAHVLVFGVLVLMHKTRASYLSLMILTPLVLALELKRNVWPAAAALVLAAAALAGGLLLWSPETAAGAAARARSIANLRDGSNRGRLVIWKRAVEVFAEHPVNGIGYRRFNRRHVELGDEEHAWSFWHAHSEWFSMLAETGLIGLAGWLAFKLKLLAVLVRERRRLMGAYLLYLLLAFEIHNLFESYLYERIAYIYIYLLLGLGFSQWMRPRAEAAAPLAAVGPAA